MDAYDRSWLVRLFSPAVVESVGWRRLKKLGALEHPNVVRVGGQLVFDGQPGIVREWVDGQALDSFWGAHARISEVEKVFQSILHGVKAAHSMGIVHGSLNPSRIYMAQTGQVQVVDFSLGSWLPPRPMDAPWLAPERRERFEFDERADIYALGAILYWLATGTIPQRTPIPAQGLRRDIPSSLLRAISGAMEPDRDRRFPSCTILDELVGEVMAQDAVGGLSFPIGLEEAAVTGGSEDRTAEEVIRWDTPLSLTSRMARGGGPDRGQPAQRKIDEPPVMTRAAAAPARPGLEDLFRDEPEEILPPVEQVSVVSRVISTRDPASQSLQSGGHTIGVRDVLGVVLGGVLLGVLFAFSYRLSQPKAKVAEVKPAVPVAEHPATVSTIFEFAGAIPDEVVVQCPESYQTSMSLVGGRAVVPDIPNVNGCTMFVRGISVDQPVAVRQGGVYHCVINRSSLLCK